MGTVSPPGPHMHTMEVTMSDINAMKAGKSIKVVTSTNGGHNHEIEIEYNKKWNTRK